MISELINIFGCQYKLYKRINKYNSPYYILKKKTSLFFVPYWEPVFASFDKNDVVYFYMKENKARFKNSIAFVNNIMYMNELFESQKRL